MSVVDRGAADWVQNELEATHRQRPRLGPAPTLSGFHRIAVQLLCDGMGCGPWNLLVRWEKVDWRCGQGVRVPMAAPGGLATYDFDHLTRLVVLAHDRCVRVDLTPRAKGHLDVYLHPRSRTADSSMARHPDLESAVARIRAGVR